MEVTVTIASKRYALDGNPIDISIPVHFGKEQIVLFSAPPATREAYAAGNFIGDASQGGSCNCDMIRFSPHLHGTHTECAGHIARVPMHAKDVAPAKFIPTTLVTVEPGSETTEHYDPALKPGDKVITRAALEKVLGAVDKAFLEALVVRTLPNDAAKRVGNYDKTKPPFFSNDAMRYMNEMGVSHLLADIPSIDRTDDEGRLSNHHIFWGVPQGTHITDAKNASPKTVTELIYVPDTATDGTYLLNLQVAAISGDAAPSRPLLYTIKAA